jgi:hypothetical protein
MKKLLVALIVLIVLIAAAAGGAIWYAAPATKLNLGYEEVPLADRAMDMARRWSTEMILSERDVDNLATKQLALHPEYEPGVTVTGARFSLSGNLLVAHVNVKWRERIPVGLTLTYRLTWSKPNLTAHVIEARVKEVRLPTASFDDVVIPLGDELPKLLQIQDVRLENGQAVIQFRKPSLRDLQSLLR